MGSVRFLLLALPLLAFPGALSQSVKSCGGPNDHLKNPVIKLTPDPVTKGGTLTIEASGTLDEALTDVNANLDINVTALGIVHASVKGGLPLSITPGAAKGPFSLTVGPFSLPANIPGKTVVKGQVHLVNAKNEPIMCLDLDMTVSAKDNEEAAPPQVETPFVTGITSCGKATDHMPDLQITTSAGVATMTGTLDEAVTSPTIAVDVSLKVLIISVPLKLNIPLATSPGLAKGAIKAVVGPSTVVVSPAVKATVKGTMKVNDAKGEEVACVNVDTTTADDDHIVV